MCDYHIIIAKPPFTKPPFANSPGERFEYEHICQDPKDGELNPPLLNHPLRTPEGRGRDRLWLRFSRGWVRKDGNLLTETGCITIIYLYLSLSIYIYIYMCIYIYI